MRAISDTVGVEEGAVRAIEAGADALCLGHDLHEDSVRSVCDALVGAVRSGRLDESRLGEAAARVHGISQWASREPFHEGVSSEVGRAAARRALHVVGDASLSLPALVVELEPEPSMAAGHLPQGPGDWFRKLVPETEVVRLQDETVDGVLALADGRQLVIVARDAHRHAWEQSAVEKLLAGTDDSVVVELGLPSWQPDGARAYVTTHGAGRVNVEAAAERLYSGTRRGVEQSGSSPGS